MSKIDDKKAIRAGMALAGMDRTPFGRAVGILLSPDQINRSKTTPNAQNSPNDNDDDE